MLNSSQSFQWIFLVPTLPATSPHLAYALPLLPLPFLNPFEVISNPHLFIKKEKCLFGWIMIHLVILFLKFFPVSFSFQGYIDFTTLALQTYQTTVQLISMSIRKLNMPEAVLWHQGHLMYFSMASSKLPNENIFCINSQTIWELFWTLPLDLNHSLRKTDYVMVEVIKCQCQGLFFGII